MRCIQTRIPASGLLGAVIRCCAATVATGYTAAGLDTGTASGTLEIGRIDLHFVAACHGTVPLGANQCSASSQRLASTDALLCRFSAAVSLQEVIRAVGGSKKLSAATYEAMTTSGACGCEALACACAYGRFKRVFRHLGCLAFESVDLLLFSRCP